MIDNVISLIAGATATAFMLWLGARAGSAAAEQPAPAGLTDADEALLQWIHATRLSVISVSGTHFEMSLAEVHRSDHPGLRTWNVPISVALYDPRDRETLEFHQYGSEPFYG